MFQSDQNRVLAVAQLRKWKLLQENLENPKTSLEDDDWVKITVETFWNILNSEPVTVPVYFVIDFHAMGMDNF